MQDSLYGSDQRIVLLQQLLEQLGNPDQQLCVIHVSGTNGKGSISYMIASILQASGYQVGLFSSPYLLDPCEQVQINQQLMPTDAVPQYEQRVAAALAALDDPSAVVSPFEKWFLMALSYFADHQVQYAVLECGIGGELDATNAIFTAAYTVFARIGIDHQDMLGHSLAEIATTKSRIIRPNSVVVSVPGQPDIVRHILTAEAGSQQAHFVDGMWANIELVVPQVGYDTVVAKVFGQQVRFGFGLQGSHQYQNLRAVLVWYAQFCYHSGWAIRETLLDTALRALSLPGRMEHLPALGSVYLDVAHNQDSVAAFANQLAVRHIGQRKILVVGFLKDKEIEACVNLLKEVADYVVITEPDHDTRRLPAETCYQVWQQSGYPMEQLLCEPNSAQAFATALDLRESEQDCVFVVGSFYLVAAVKRALAAEASD